MPKSTIICDFDEFARLVKEQAKNLKIQDRRITRKEAAAILGISTRTFIRKYKDPKILKNLNPNGKSLYLLSDVMKLMKIPGQR